MRFTVLSITVRTFSLYPLPRMSMIPPPPTPADLPRIANSWQNSDLARNCKLKGSTLERGVAHCYKKKFQNFIYIWLWYKGTSARYAMRYSDFRSIKNLRSSSKKFNL